MLSVWIPGQLNLLPSRGCSDPVSDRASASRYRAFPANNSRLVTGDSLKTTWKIGLFYDCNRRSYWTFEAAKRVIGNYDETVSRPIT